MTNVVVVHVINLFLMYAEFWTTQGSHPSHAHSQITFKVRTDNEHPHSGKDEFRVKITVRVPQTIADGVLDF